MWTKRIPSDNGYDVKQTLDIITGSKGYVYEYMV